MGIRDRVAAGRKAADTNKKKRADYYRAITRGNGENDTHDLPEMDYHVYIGEKLHSIWHSRQPARNTKRDLKKYSKVRARIVAKTYSSEGFILEEREVS